MRKGTSREPSRSGNRWLKQFPGFTRERSAWPTPIWKRASTRRRCPCCSSGRPPTRAMNKSKTSSSSRAKRRRRRRRRATPRGTRAGRQHSRPLHLEEVAGVAIVAAAKPGDRLHLPRIDAALRVEQAVVDVKQHHFADHEVGRQLAVANRQHLPEHALHVQRRFGQAWRL